MIIIVLAKEYKQARHNYDSNALWCYIGKDVVERRKISDFLGENKRFFLKDRLHKTAEEFRQPFLDFVAFFGRRQQNQLNWWASRFASRSPFQTDFFLLLCYKSLTGRIIDEHCQSGKSVYVFIEDCWLFKDLKEMYRNRIDIRFVGGSCFFKEKLLFFFKGIISRIILLIQIILQRVFLCGYASGITGRSDFKIGETNKGKAVGILSYCESRSLTDDTFVDYYTAGLGELLCQNGFNVTRPLHLIFSLRDVGKIRKRKGLWPLICDLCFLDILANIIKWWKPDIQRSMEGNLFINGCSVYNLVKREMWEEFSSASFNLNLFFHCAMSRFLKRRWCGALVYIYENQPWEKMLCMARGKAGSIKLIAYQHSSMPKFLLSQFLGKGEEEYMPLPDKILTTGNYLCRRYQEGGIPEDKLRVAGAWRYEYLWKGTNTPEKKNIDAPDLLRKRIVLVALPVDPVNAKALLFLILDKYPDGGRSKKIEFWIKSHPDVPLSKINIRHRGYKNLKFVNEPADKLFDKVEAVIYSNSGMGLEAVLYGKKKVIRYVPENMIDMDRIDWIKEAPVFTVYDGDELDKILLCESTIERSIDDLSSLCNAYFEEVNPDVWIDEFSKFTGN